jgi:hypothetical protein
MMKIVAKAKIDSLDQAGAVFGLDWTDVAKVVSVCYCARSTYNSIEEKSVTYDGLSFQLISVRRSAIKNDEHASVRKVDSLKLGVVFEAQGEKR